jgi:hypothetical protein
MSGYTAPRRRDLHAIRWAGLFLCAAALSLVPASEGRSAVQWNLREAKSTSAALQSIATWLERSGEHGWMGADVADALDILRLQTEESVAARQRAFRTGETLHLAQVSADERREFLLFMVKGPDGQVHFYLSTVSEGFKRAFVTVPGQRAVLLLDAAAAERGFRAEVVYWEGIISTR